MRLTAIWCHLKNKKPHGKLYRGKNRIVKDPAAKDLVTLHSNMQLQERNMLLLRHPYLTVEQDRGHMMEFRAKPNMRELARDVRNAKFQKHFTWTDQLIHLRCKDCWD